MNILIALFLQTHNLNEYALDTIVVKDSLTVLQKTKKTVNLQEITPEHLQIKLYPYAHLVSVKGSNSENVRVMIEDFPINSYQSGFFDLNLLPFDLLENATLGSLNGFSPNPHSPPLSSYINIFIPRKTNELSFYLESKNFLKISVISKFKPNLTCGFSLQKFYDSYTTPKPEYFPYLIEFTNNGGIQTGFFASSAKSTILLSLRKKGIPDVKEKNPNDSLDQSFFFFAHNGDILSIKLSHQNLTYKNPSLEPSKNSETQLSLFFNWRKLFFFSTELVRIISDNLENNSLSLYHNASFSSRRLPLPFYLDFGTIARYQRNGGIHVYTPHFVLIIPKEKPFFLSVSSSQRLPTFNELFWMFDGFAEGNRDLKPEKTQEASLTTQMAFINNFLDFELFFRVYKDKIMWTPQKSGIWKPLNIEENKIFGASLTIESFPSKYLSLYIYSEVIANLSSLNLVYTPPYRVNLMLNLFNTLNLKFDYLSGRHYLISGPKKLAPGYLLEVELHRRFKNLLTRVGFKNLLNQWFEITQGFPDMGRRIFLDLRIEI